MAYVSSTFNTTNTYVKYRLVVDLISQDVNSNTSTINVQLQAWRTNTGYETYGSGTASVNVEGSQHNQSISSSQKITYNSYTVLYNANHTISHNADGTKSPNIGGYFSIASVVSGGWNYFSFSLPTIPRASTVSATNADIGSATSINIGRYSTSFTHTLKYSFGSLSGTIANGVETSYGWTVPTSFYAEVPNSVTGTCTITCETYNGATLIGTSQTTFSATVNEAVNKPDISATISDSNTTTATLTGNNQNMVKYFSNAAFSITATPKNSATIVSRSITCEGLSSTSTSGTLTAVESGTFVVATIDSRGFSNSVTYNRTLVDYVRLTFNPVVYRPAPTTGEVALTFNGNYFNSTFGSVANQLGETAGSYRIYWRSREKGTSTWSAYTTVNVTRSGNTYNNGASPISLGTGFTYTKAYEFDFKVLDKLTTLIVPVQSVSQGIPVFNWDRTSFSHNTEVISSGSFNQGSYNIPTKGALTQIIDESYSQHSVIVGRNGSGARVYGIDFLDQTADPNIRIYSGSKYINLNNSGLFINGNSLKKEVLTETCYLPVSFNAFRPSYKISPTTNSNVPLKKLYGDLGLNSGMIVFKKGYVYSILSNSMAYNMALVMYLELRNNATNTSILSAPDNLYAVTGGAPEVGSIGFGYLDLTSASSDMTVKFYCTRNDGGTLQDDWGGIQIIKYKTITI